MQSPHSLAWQVTLQAPCLLFPPEGPTEQPVWTLDWAFGQYLPTPYVGCLHLSSLPSQTSLICWGPPPPGSPPRLAL